VVSDATGEALIELIDALTTNFTSFLREKAHFEYLSAAILPTLRDRDRIAIWSAASSTGEPAIPKALAGSPQVPVPGFQHEQGPEPMAVVAASGIMFCQQGANETGPDDTAVQKTG